MKPKKPKDIYPEVCKTVDENQDVVEAVVDFYWKKARKMMESQDYLRINIDYIGDFLVARNKLRAKICKYERLKKRYSEHSYKQYDKAKQVALKYDKYIELLNKIEEERDKKYGMQRSRHEKNN